MDQQQTLGRFLVESAVTGAALVMFLFVIALIAVAMGAYQ